MSRNDIQNPACRLCPLCYDRWRPSYHVLFTISSNCYIRHMVHPFLQLMISLHQHNTADMNIPIRRVITAHDPKGIAYFASDDILTPYDPTTAPDFLAPTPESSFGVIQIHRSRTFPVNNQRPLTSEPNRTLVPLADTKGPSCRIIDLPPAESGWMHRTLSLDYAVILSGTAGFITDGGEEKILKEHDVIVCRGTNHEWVNRGEGLARIFVVVIPSLPVVTEDGTVLEKTQAGEIFDPKEEDD
ncbi:hypothetical protein BGW36DRAFT_189612 [Talaromyces proteolyticus]|uniref:Uncharacterized protein n=1 Tax=Talaromyces proteolyticus TaxID=1131652 RepID=A0AAD4Q085_9EURO|nr:uncharacterized protein BGW36DRAFT_189612 [Talaromyces proteolyticus]KAH8696653.1 hypothetical protein BGW36DRAFT_189612 [Talaromyces proteolyticus]